MLLSKPRWMKIPFVLAIATPHQRRSMRRRSSDCKPRRDAPAWLMALAAPAGFRLSEDIGVAEDLQKAAFDFHGVSGNLVRNRLEGRLPKCSPDLNPIEPGLRQAQTSVSQGRSLRAQPSAGNGRGKVAPQRLLRERGLHRALIRRTLPLTAAKASSMSSQ
jgi:hypothetical protein